MLQVTFSKETTDRKNTALVKVVRVDGPEYYIEESFKYVLGDPKSFNLAMQKAREYISVSQSVRRSAL